MNASDRTLWLPSSESSSQKACICAIFSSSVIRDSRSAARVGTGNEASLYFICIIVLRNFPLARASATERSEKWVLLRIVYVTDDPFAVRGELVESCPEPAEGHEWARSEDIPPFDRLRANGSGELSATFRKLNRCLRVEARPVLPRRRRGNAPDQSRSSSPRRSARNNRRAPWRSAPRPNRR